MRSSLETTPAQVAPVDWEHYRKVVKTPGVVDAVKHEVCGGQCGASPSGHVCIQCLPPLSLTQYESLTFVYPEDTLSSTIESAKKDAVLRDSKGLRAHWWRALDGLILIAVVGSWRAPQP